MRPYIKFERKFITSIFSHIASFSAINSFASVTIYLISSSESLPSSLLIAIDSDLPVPLSAIETYMMPFASIQW